jgi:hypothetical protein
LNKALNQYQSRDWGAGSGHGIPTRFHTQIGICPILTYPRW